jgi:Tfp pilus assembly protein PilX
MRPSLNMKLRLSLTRSVCCNENGAVLVIGLVFLALLAMTGTTAVVITSTDMQIGGNYKTGTQASWDAEAGVNYGLAKMEAGLKASPSATFSLPTVVGDPTDPSDTNSVALSPFTTPTGFGFSFKAPGLTMLDTNLYTFTSDGTAANNSNMTITVTCRQKPAITMAAFGDTKMDGKSGGTVESFDSSSSDPTKNDPTDPSFQSTHEADIGSNEWLVTHSGVDVDGNGVLGEDAGGAAATDSIADYNDFYGNETPVVDERIDPDPLGVTSGGEFDPTTYAPPNNDNCSNAIPGDPHWTNLCNNNELDLGNGDTMILTAGDYYINSGKGLELGNGSTLTIDASAGEVRIFLDGEGVTAANGSVLNVIGDATDFSVFSNSTVKIDFSNSSAFTGLVYAPFAPVDIKNSGAVTGAIWGSNVDIKNSGNLYYDSALADKFTTKDMELVTWRDVRN